MHMFHHNMGDNVANCVILHSRIGNKLVYSQQVGISQAIIFATLKKFGVFLVD